MYRKEILAALLSNVRGVAKEYRLAAPLNKPHLRADGYCIVWEGKCEWWARELPRPGETAPGCVAVGCNGDIHLAVGGDYADGAEKWERLA